MVEPLTAEVLAALPYGDAEPVEAVIRGEGREFTVKIRPATSYSVRAPIATQSEARTRLFQARALELPGGREVKPDKTLVFWSTVMEYRVVEPRLEFPQWVELAEKDASLWFSIVDAINRVDGADAEDLDDLKAGGGGEPSAGTDGSTGPSRSTAA